MLPNPWDSVAPRDSSKEQLQQECHGNKLLANSLGILWGCSLVTFSSILSFLWKCRTGSHHKRELFHVKGKQSYEEGQEWVTLALAAPGNGWTPRPWRAFPALEGFSSLNDSMIPPVCPSPLGIRNHHISKHLQTQDTRNISPHCVPLSLVYFVPLETPCPDPPISIRDFAIPIIGDSLERSWLENISKNIKVQPLTKYKT